MTNRSIEAYYDKTVLKYKLRNVNGYFSRGELLVYTNGLGYRYISFKDPRGVDYLINIRSHCEAISKGEAVDWPKWITESSTINKKDMRYIQPSVKTMLWFPTITGDDRFSEVDTPLNRMSYDEMMKKSTEQGYHEVNLVVQTPAITGIKVYIIENINKL